MTSKNIKAVSKSETNQKQKNLIEIYVFLGNLKVNNI
jgi:hypothetical protein